jgi:hypothetical protein
VWSPLGSVAGFERGHQEPQLSVPRVIVTAKLASYGAATRELLPRMEHRQHRYLNNRAENSPQPTCQRERRMGQCQSPGQAPALSRGLWPDRMALPPPTSSLLSPCVPPGDGATFPDPARHHRHDHGRIRAERRSPGRPRCLVITSQPMHLTVPLTKPLCLRHTRGKSSARLPHEGDRAEGMPRLAHVRRCTQV